MAYKIQERQKMPAPLLTRDEILERLLALFRCRGYQGASMSLISKETGLGKASLYHHFPGGKDEMVEEVLNHLDSILEQFVIEPLSGSEPPIDKLNTMIKNIDQFYAGGEKPCVFESLSLNAESGAADTKIKEQMRSWIKAMELLSIESGHDTKAARERAEEAMASIQGALIVARTTNNKSVFSRALKRLPDVLLK